MQSSRIIKRRIKTTKNIRQITKAMEMVAASKMRKAQMQATSSKPYSNKLQESLRRLASSTDTHSHPLLKTNKSGKNIAILIGPDKGLTGGMISNLLKEADMFAGTKNGNGDFEFITVGKKAREYAIKMGFDIMAEFSNMADNLSFEETLPISKLILDGYQDGTYKDVCVIYMDFISTLVQKSNLNQILPISVDPLLAPPETPEKLIEKDVAGRYEYIFEPSAQEILDWLLPYYVEVQIYQTILEAKASEHSARMVAMKGASDNAGEIISDLTLAYNKSRQANITNELLDITTATYTS
ncbi:ATP synthase F1 subunit gamma [Patescibacteria group bacterium]